jgi:hypothetical protein
MQSQRSEIHAEPTNWDMLSSVGLLSAGCLRRPLSFTYRDIRAPTVGPSWTCNLAPAVWNPNGYNYHHISPLNVVDEWLSLILCVLEVPVSYLGTETGYHERFPLFSSPQASARLVPQITPRHHLSISGLLSYWISFTVWYSKQHNFSETGPVSETFCFDELRLSLPWVRVTSGARMQRKLVTVWTLISSKLIIIK